MQYLIMAIKKDLKSKLWCLLLLLPLVMGLFWAGYQGTINQQNTKYAIGLVDLDQSKQSLELTKGLSDHPSLDVIVYPTAKAAENGMIKKEILQSYIVKKGFEKTLLEGDYRNIVEVVSMIKSPYSDWLNDQISVGVIREWLISDGYLRLQKLSPDYNFESYEEAFLAYYDKNELLAFTVIEQVEGSKVVSRSDTVVDKGFIWLWSVYCFLVTLYMTRLFYKEWHNDIWKRLQLSGVSHFTYYMRFLFKVACVVLMGTGLSLVATRIMGLTIGIVYYQLALGALITLIFLLAIGRGMIYLPLNINQLTIAYSAVFLTLCFLSSTYIELLPFGKYLQYLSPMTLFFKICL